MNEDFYISLIYKKLSGDIDQGDQKQLDEWLSENEENRQTYQAIQLAWEESPAAIELPKVDLDVEFAALEQKLDDSPKDLEVEEKEPKVKPLFPIWARVAAGIVLLAGLGFILQNLLKQEGPMIALQEIKAEEEVMKITLPDSSLVHLQPHSTLSFPQVFAESQREVQLEGEAFFDVERNEAKPFKIEASGTIIEVLGTSFGVKAFPDQSERSVLVTEGKVAFQVAGSAEKLILEQNEKGVFDLDEGTLTKTEKANSNEYAWANQTLIFNQKSIDEVFVDLENYYGVALEFNKNELNNCYFSGIYRDAPIETVFEAIEAILSFTFEEISPNKYQVKGSPCE